MKTLLLTVFIVFALNLSTARADPFLVCDPQQGVISYELEINGVLAAGFSAEPDGSMRYDLGGLDPGSYGVRARCRNLYYWSQWSHEADDPFVFTKALPQAPNGLRVSFE